MKKINTFCTLLVAPFFMIACNQNGGYNGGYNISNTAIDTEVSENYTEYGENRFISVSEEPISTFSIDADGASYANTRRFLNLGQRPPVAAVRVEEFLNYFTFNYGDPVSDENVALSYEVSSCPWNLQHQLMRVGIKGKTIANESLPDANYVFLIDVSGSMSSPDKLPLLKTGFKTMVDEMRDTDSMAIVTYAGAATILLESTFGDEKQKIKNAIDQLGAAGGTAGAEGILTAYQIAEESFIPGGNNRIILGSDGDFNVGASSVDELVELVESKKENGVYLTVLGVGSGNLNDALMEQIANNGNGNYEYIDNLDQLNKVFVNEKGKFYSVAKDSKVQITFNPSIVDSYRLIGYENRALDAEDFIDDAVDAGEIGSGQTITALYELTLLDGSGAGTIADFDFRYKKPESTISQELNINIENTTTSTSEASENMKFAAGVAGFGMILKESEFKGDLNKTMVSDLIGNAISFDPYGYKAEFVDLVNKLN